MTGKKMKFEEALKRLEEIVSKMEAGQLPLDESLACFEEGMALSAFCEQTLNKAEGTVEKLLKAHEETDSVMEEIK